MEEPEPALIRAAGAGDLAAFERLVRLPGAGVALPAPPAGRPGVAEDVAQETFLRVPATARSRSRPGSPPGCSRSHATPAWTSPSPQSTQPAGVAGAAADVDGGHARGRAEIDAALASLPVDLREAILLIEVLGLRYHEVARVLRARGHRQGSRVFSARTRLHRWSTADDERASREV